MDPRLGPRRRVHAPHAGLRSPRMFAARSWCLLLALLLIAPVSRSTLARSRTPTACPSLFVGGQPPALLNGKLAQKTRLLCFEAFAVLASGVTRGPLWSAERLTAATIRDARRTPRKGTFHAESALTRGDRAELSDYARSGYDRGHMAPSGDMPDPRSLQQSFSLANVLPQAPELNRRAWQIIESAVRDYAAAHGLVYVVTGPVFQGSGLQALNGRVLVPTSTYKAIYDPDSGAAGAYICSNAEQPECRTASVTNVERLSGVDPFPAVPARVKAAMMAMPPLRPDRSRRR